MGILRKMFYTDYICQMKIINNMNERIDLTKISNNAFIKPQLKLMQFLLSARKQNKRVITLKRKNKL